MGFSSPVEDQIKNLRRVRNQLITAVEFKNIELEKSKEEITKLDNQMTQEKDEIKQFSHSLSKEELELRAKKLISLEKDKAREKQNNERLDKYNELLKNNLNSVESKINELEFYKNIKGVNDVLTNLIDTSNEISKNAITILSKNENDDKNKGELTAIDKVITGNNKTPDDVLKEILGDTKTVENGGFY